jgi:hypothetical protein
MKHAAVLAIFFSAVSFSMPATGRETGALLMVVDKLYADFSMAGAGAKANSEPIALVDQPRAVLEKYFDSQLATLWLRDRQCVARTHEICRLDFDPISASQMGTVEHLHIRPGKQPATVEAEFSRLDGDRGKIVLTYYLVKTAHGWRIDDIRSQYDSDEAWSLRKILASSP